jgi:arsenite-transporting ATPase
VPILVCPYFEREVVGAAMLDRLATATFADLSPEAVLHRELSQELVAANGSATLRLQIPFAEKADVGLKKIGLELVVRVGPQKRTIILPPALAAYRPSAARFEEGALEVFFEKRDDQIPQDTPAR